MPRLVSRCPSLRRVGSRWARKDSPTRRPRGTPDRRALRRVARPHRSLPDRLGQRAGPGSLPAAVQPGRALPDVAAATGPPTGARGLLFEYWGHEASLLPVELQPLLRWRMATRATTRGVACGGSPRTVPTCSAALLADITADGPLDRRRAQRATRSAPAATDRTVVGLVRRQARARVPVLGGRDHHRRSSRLRARLRPARAGAARRGPRRADSRSRGGPARAAPSIDPLAGRGDRARPARLLPAARRRTAKARIAELVEAGELLPVAGRGLEALRPISTRRPRCRAGSARAALLSPFDPVVWERDRTERLFGFRYRIEIYVPAHKRVHGYYVLPFLLDDALVARVDLKADRTTGPLLVQSAWAEPDAPAGDRRAARRASCAGWPTGSAWPTSWSSAGRPGAAACRGLARCPDLAAVDSPRVHPQVTQGPSTARRGPRWAHGSATDVSGQGT